MFKLFYFYPFIAFVCFWLASDVEIGASVYEFEDNHISIEFPKASFREKDEKPWVDLYWNAASSREEIIEIKETVIN